jgi:hypothetical protein
MGANPLRHSNREWEGGGLQAEAAKLENAPVDFGGLSRVKRLYIGVLVHIKISRNGAELTEISSPPPPGTSNIKAAKLKNAPVDFGGLLRVERAVNRCISAYRDLPKRRRTHRDRFYPSWYLSGNPTNLHYNGGMFPFHHAKQD